MRLPPDAAARDRRGGPKRRPPAAYTSRRTDCRNAHIYAIGFSEHITGFFIGWRGERDLVCSGLISHTARVPREVCPTWRRTQPGSAAQGGNPCRSTIFGELSRFCRGAGDHRDRMVHDGPRAGTDRLGVDPILDDGVLLAQVGFSKAVLPCFFATSSAHCIWRRTKYSYLRYRPVIILVVEQNRNARQWLLRASRWRSRRRSAHRSVGDRVARYTLW